MVADEIILEDGPVIYLLSLEHQLTEVLGFMRALQLTDPAEDWVRDENDACWRSRNPEQRLRMEKGLKSLVLIAPTQHQLSQAQAVPDGHRTGVWEITKFSGAVSRERKAQLIENAEALLAGLRQARERANHEGARRSASAARAEAATWPTRTIRSLSARSGQFFGSSSPDQPRLRG